MFTAWEVRAPLAIGFTGDLGGSQDLEAFEALNLSCLSTTEICPINSSTLNGWWGALARQAGRWAATPGAIRETLSGRTSMELVTGKALILYLPPTIKGKAISDDAVKIFRRATVDWFTHRSLGIPVAI